MNKMDKSVKFAGKAVLKGRTAALVKPPAAKSAAKTGAAKPALLKAAPAPADDAPVIALNLPMAKLTPAMASYFKKCQEKLGFVPNVLSAYAFDNAKLEAFVAMYNDLMLAPSGLSKLEADALRMYLEGSSYEDMADELGCDTKTIDNALQRVKRKILTHQQSREVLQ